MLNKNHVFLGIYTAIILCYTLRPIDSSDVMVSGLETLVTRIFVFTDIFINIFMYIPWGFLMMLLIIEDKNIGSVGPWILISSAIALSASIEAFQFFIPTRYPSVLDILANTAGATIGGLFAVIVCYLIERGKSF